MGSTRATKKPLPLFYKLGGGLLVICCLILGVIGLIMPIIPGLVFLFLALYLLSKLSRRVATYAESKPWFHYHLRHLHAANGLSLGARMKLGALLVARGAVEGVQAVLFWCRSRLKGS